MSKNIWCKLGFHTNDIYDWNSDEPKVRCKECGHVGLMTGEVLAEWKQYRAAKQEYDEVHLELKRKGYHD